ncbi:MAG: hypothetical protein AAB835_02260 [Patescibacteria group bacterium]
MTFKINTYFAALLITIFGAAASMLIIHVANANTFVITTGYDSL